MTHIVNFSIDAKEDLLDIYNRIEAKDSQQIAVEVYSNLKEACRSLDEFPERGHIPPELDFIGIREYREIHFKPYRVIYTITGDDVFIHCILDGRRDLEDLLYERLLR